MQVLFHFYFGLFFAIISFMVIKNNAIFIADAHYNSLRTELLELLKKIEKNEIEVSQIFFMGDIFDFLSDEIDYFQNINFHLIDIINKLANKIETIYFEGNHDYNLKYTFPKLQVIPREHQPLYAKLNEQNKKRVALAHGDIYTPKKYNIYCKIIRNSFLLTLLNFINFNNWLSKIVENKLKAKKICHPMESFLEFVNNRVELYKTDLIIEGHFHQGYQDSRYINVPSLACSSQYMIYNNKQFKFIKV